METYRKMLGHLKQQCKTEEEFELLVRHYAAQVKVIQGMKGHMDEVMEKFQTAAKSWEHHQHKQKLERLVHLYTVFLQATSIDPVLCYRLFFALLLSFIF